MHCGTNSAGKWPLYSRHQWGVCQYTVYLLFTVQLGAFGTREISLYTSNGDQRVSSHMSHSLKMLRKIVAVQLLVALDENSRDQDRSNGSSSGYSKTNAPDIKISLYCSHPAWSWRTRWLQAHSLPYFPQRWKYFHDNLGAVGRRWTLVSAFTATRRSKLRRCCWLDAMR